MVMIILGVVLLLWVFRPPSEKRNHLNNNFMRGTPSYFLAEFLASAGNQDEWTEQQIEYFKRLTEEAKKPYREQVRLGIEISRHCEKHNNIMTQYKAQVLKNEITAELYLELTEAENKRFHDEFPNDKKEAADRLEQARLTLERERLIKEKAEKNRIKQSALYGK
jgi:hypothetical protein